MREGAKKEAIEYVEFIDLDIFQDKISVVFTDSPIESIQNQVDVNKLNLNQYGWSKKGDAGAAVFSIEESHYRAIWVVFDIDEYREDIVVHECMHLCTAIVYARGIEYSPATDEVYAYTIQYLYEQIIEIAKRAFKEYENQTV